MGKFYFVAGIRYLPSILRRLFLSETANFHNESRLERSEIEIATMLSHVENHGQRRTGYTNLQVTEKDFFHF